MFKKNLQIFILQVSSKVDLNGQRLLNKSLKFLQEGFKQKKLGDRIIKQKNNVMSLRRGRNQPVQLSSYQYEAHASNISDMHVVISRRKIHLETTPQPPRELDNPYVFKPKSYSTKRSTPQEILQKPLKLNPTKKTKREDLPIKEPSIQLACDFLQLGKILKNTAETFFSPQFLNNNLLQNDDAIQKKETKDQENGKKLNPMMKNQITIISNDNKKIQAIIHEGLLLSNTAHSKVGKEEHFLKQVINPFDFQRRSNYLKLIKFEKDYKSGYAPIEMQQKNAEEPYEINTNTNQISKTHFIRKKQSTLSLPRSCGVSYIKPSQSFQIPPFDPLPPLIFQCSSKCAQSKQMLQKYEQISNLFNNVSQNCWVPYIQTTQENMRFLLLGKRVGQVGWVKGVQNIWPIFSEGTFLLFLYCQKFCLNEEDIWKSFGECPFKIGILIKKSTSGKKAFLKSLNIRQAKSQQQAKQQKADFHQNNTVDRMPIDQIQLQQQHKTSSLQDDIANELRDCRTVITLSLRLEMYVQEKQWKSSLKQTKDMLNYLITSFKDSLEKNSLNIIRKRIMLAKLQQKQTMFEQISKPFRLPAKDKSKEIEYSKLAQSTIIVEESKLKAMLESHMYLAEQNNNQLLKNTESMDYQSILKNNKTQTNWQKTLKMPLYYISTRDSFAFDLIEEVTYYQRQNGRQYKKIQYFFEPDNLPTNYGKEYKQRFPRLNVGVTCYHNFFSNEQLKQFEKNTFGTQINAFKNKFLQMTVQPSIVGNKIKRTKFFFGYRYMWTRCQLAEPGSYIGAGVRKDVTPAPKWTQTLIDELVKSSIAEKDFINSIAINVYHDGKEGLAQHFDDAVRFRQPIYTLRLFSDARLSFGSQFYGFCNGAFIIPLPRGCICVMQQNSYAANGVKHCVRPCDMTGKSSAVILRQMHHKVVSESKRYDEFIDFPAWISCLSRSSQAVTFAQQKRREAEFYINNPKDENIGK